MTSKSTIRLIGALVQNKRLEAAEELAVRINDARLRATASFSEITDAGRKNPQRVGRIAVMLERECLIHAHTFAEAAEYARKGLLAYAAQNYDVEPTELEQIAWKLSVDSIKLVVQAIEIDRDKEYVELGAEIATSLAGLAGAFVAPLAVLKESVEISEKIRKIRGLKNLNLGPFKDTGELLTRWELYMMRGLLASRNAIVQVDALLLSRDMDSSDLTLEERVVELTDKATKFVTGGIYGLQQKFPGKNLGITFPIGGMWPLPQRDQKN